jgi:ubiquinone/menaquinone biosynthesis C-methylase UbiE
MSLVEASRSSVDAFDSSRLTEVTAPQERKARKSDMNHPATRAQIDAATAYEEFFVPALFGEWAPRVLAAARLEPGDRVLDVACGTGVLAREAITRVAATGSVAGVDPNPGMLTVAARLAPEVEWRQGTAESLPYPDRSFDVVVSQFGLMFFTDRRLALRDILRVLVPGGRLAIAVWDYLDNIPAYAAVVRLLERTAGRHAADALRAPFALGNRAELSQLFRDEGVASVKITTGRGAASFPGVRPMVEADLRGWLPVMGIVLPEDQVARALAEAEHALEPFVTPDGSVAFETSAHLVTGNKVSE